MRQDFPYQLLSNYPDHDFKEPIESVSSYQGVVEVTTRDFVYAQAGTRLWKKTKRKDKEK